MVLNVKMLYKQYSGEKSKTGILNKIQEIKKGINNFVTYSMLSELH